jgi:2-oxoglutarate ferredoxin oxidoreductase subunit beta
MTTEYKKKDFQSDQEVKWCPGCGDYAILSAVQMALTKIGRKREDIAFVSGIGCSSRFPYYMGTYGYHTIHGRAPAFASGLKVTNPDLSVWLITGDGDGLSIGGNHLIHAIRRNVDMNIILFNNEIYGLTKGQYSPTSKQGIVTKSTPYGSLDRSFSPAKLAFGANSTFIARTMDTDPKHMQEVMLAAENHRGCSFIETYQNCVIFNDKVHEAYTNRKTRNDHSIFLEDGKPMIYGADNNKALVLDGLTIKAVELGGEYSESDALVHDKTCRNLTGLLLNLDEDPAMPKLYGVVYQQENVETYDAQVNAQLEDVKAKKGQGDMTALLNSGDTWSVS